VLRIAFPINSCSPCRLTVRCQPQYRTSHFLSYKSASPVNSGECFVLLFNSSSTFLFAALSSLAQYRPGIPVAASLTYAQSGAAPGTRWSSHQKWDSTSTSPSTERFTGFAVCNCVRLVPLLACEHYKRQQLDNHLIAQSITPTLESCRAARKSSLPPSPILRQNPTITPPP